MPPLSCCLTYQILQHTGIRTRTSVYKSIISNKTVRCIKKCTAEHMPPRGLHLSLMHIAVTVALTVALTHHNITGAHAPPSTLITMDDGGVAQTFPAPEDAPIPASALPLELVGGEALQLPVILRISTPKTYLVEACQEFLVHAVQRRVLLQAVGHEIIKGVPARKHCGRGWSSSNAPPCIRHKRQDTRRSLAGEVSTCRHSSANTSTIIIRRRIGRLWRRRLRGDRAPCGVSR